MKKFGKIQYFQFLKKVKTLSNTVKIDGKTPGKKTNFSEGIMSISLLNKKLEPLQVGPSEAKNTPKNMPILSLKSAFFTFFRWLFWVDFLENAF